MFIRPIHHIRALQRLQTLSQRLSTQAAINRSYATYGEICGRGPTVLQVKPILSYTSSVCYASQQAKPVEHADRSLKYGFEHVMGKLESAYQWNGFVGIDQLQPLMDVLKANPNLKLTHEQGLFLLNLCGCEMPSLTADERLVYFQHIWQFLQQSDQITKDHYHTMLQVFKFNRAPLKDYKILLQEYEKHNGSPNEILSQLLEVSGANGDVKLTTELLSEMRSLQMALTEHDFNSLLLAHARAKDMSGCQTVQDSMHATGLSISTETQSTLIVAYMENGDEAKASNILQQYHGQFKSYQVIKMLQSITACSKISQEFVSQLVKEFKSDYLKGPEVPIALRRICVELLHNDKLDYALCIIDTLPKPNFQENQDIDTYGVFLLHALFRADCELTKIIEIATRLEDTNKNTRALHVAAEIALKRNPPMALPILEALVKREQPLRPHYFWPLMMYNFRRHNESGILRTLKIMQDFKVECDHQTIVQYVLPRLSIILTNPQVALKQLEDAGLKTSLVLTPIVSHMLTQNKWFDVTPLVEAYTTKINTADLITPLCSVAVHVRATKRYHQFAKLLNALSNKNIDQKQDFVGQFLIELLSTQPRMLGDLFSIQRLLNEMQKIGLHISPAAVTALQTILTTNNGETSDVSTTINQKLKEMTKRNLVLANSTEDGSVMSSSFIKHPRDMNIDELECHLVELEAKQMNTRGVLRRLLQVCVRDNRLERAVEIKNKCDKLKVQTSPGMLASIFEMYTKLGDLAKAQESLKILQQTYPGFQIDEHKHVDYATLLVKCGQLDTAKKLLEERSLKHQIIGGDYILKNIWNLLTNVAHLAAISKDLPNERNLTRETYAFLQKLGYCRTHNAILGPIVRERLLRGDINGAIMEFKQLAQQFKHTPLQFELLSLIVRLCNGDEELSKKYNCSTEEAQKLLGDITEIVTKIHGVVNMNSGLLLAFAESGSDNQLRRLLINPEFRINEELLLRNCEHLGQEGAVRTLLRLARGARGLNRVINEQNIYNMLLNNFIKANNYEAALKLYNLLEEDDELKVSQEFLRNIVKLLNVNNIEIPSNIALRARVV
ncbi:leucine-rich PPR motif-containing protein, mitochondrial [Lucilia sericata]|uniref:leucine-rich PPR motif-containing protein, mitochondrial n=1 Tax=Lucilia sericata TaxID=13632 RepID=UPI0018A83B5E|nr:leucine-rich PPR motif-containing protein, mitochondrial [Lucilia sericata]